MSPLNLDGKVAVISATEASARSDDLTQNRAMRPAACAPKRYPRSYRPSLVFRVAVTFFAGFLCLAGASALLGGAQGRTRQDLSFAFMGIAFVMLFALSMTVFALRFRIVLAATSIERRVLRARRLERGDITSYRRAVRPNPYGQVVTYFVQVKGRRRPFAITCAFTDEDLHFKTWFAGLPEPGPGSR